MTKLTKHEKVRVEAIVLYANGKALDAVKDMPRGRKRIRAFSDAWVKAAKEYVDSAKGEK